MVERRGGEKRRVAASGGAILGERFEIEELAQAQAKPRDGEMERGLPGEDRPGFDCGVIGGDGGNALVPKKAPHAFPAIQAGIIARAGFALDQQVASIGVRRGAEGREPAGAHQQDIAGAERDTLRGEAGGKVLGGGALASHGAPIAAGAGEMPREVGQHGAPGDAVGQSLVDAVAALRAMHNGRQRRVIVETMRGVSKMRKPVPLRAALQPKAIQSVIAGDAAGVGRAGFNGLWVVGVIAFVICLIVWPTAGWISSAYTREPAVLAVATAALVLACLFFVADALQVVAAQALRSAADVWVPTLMHIFSYGVVMLPLGYFMGVEWGWGVNGIVWAAIIASLVSALLLCVRFRIVARRQLQTPRIQPSSPST